MSKMTKNIHQIGLSPSRIVPHCNQSLYKLTNEQINIARLSDFLSLLSCAAAWRHRAQPQPSLAEAVHYSVGVTGVRAACSQLEAVLGASIESLSSESILRSEGKR
jgi:hypothetical protein